MEFTLYSIGDAAFLEQVLISIAMITGSGDFETMISIGLLLGVIIVTVQSVFNGAKAINWQQVFLGWLVYGMFFFPTATVNIEDIQRGEVRPVDNVPIGIGIAGGIISNIGYGLTELMEQAYSPIYPAMSENGYIESLQVLNQARRDGYNSSVIQAINAEYGAGADFAKSATNYITECTLRKLELGTETKESLFELEILPAIQFNSSNYGTVMYLANPNGQNVTCSQGFTLLSEALGRISLGGSVDQRISQLLNLNTDLGESALREVGNGLQSLGLVSASAADYMKTAILEPLYYEAVYTRHMDLQDYSSAQMVSQAIAQRNAQWSAEHSLFLSVVDPVLAFFEGFIYGVTPIMAFIIMLGGMGITLAVKYFQVLIWVQLWYPILSITNLYMYVVSSNELASVLDSKSITTLYGLNEAGNVLQSYIATGGMLAAATPMLALFIITGSTYTFNSLASRVNGADHIDEKAMSPDMLQNGPLVKAAPMNTWNPHSGMKLSGVDKLLPNIEAGKALQAAASSAQAVAVEKTSEFSESIHDAFKTSTSGGQRTGLMRDLSSRVGSSQGQTVRSLVSQAEAFVKKHGLDESRVEQIVSGLAVSGGAQGALQAGKKAQQSSNNSSGNAGLSLGVNGNYTTSSTVGKNDNSSIVSQFANEIGYNEDTHSAFMSDLSQSYSRSTSDELSNTWGRDNAKQISTAAKEATKASETYSQLSQASQQLGLSWSVPVDVAGAELVKQGIDGSIREQLRYAPSHVKQQAAKLEQRYSNYMHMPPDVARAAAGLVALANNDTSSVSSLMGAATGANIAPQGVRQASGGAPVSHPAAQGSFGGAPAVPSAGQGSFGGAPAVPPAGQVTSGGAPAVPPAGQVTSGGAPAVPPAGQVTSGGAPAVPPAGQGSFGGAPVSPPAGQGSFGGAPAVPPAGQGSFGGAPAVPSAGQVTSGGAPAVPSAGEGSFGGATAVPSAGEVTSGGAPVSPPAGEGSFGGAPAVPSAGQVTSGGAPVSPPAGQGSSGGAPAVPQRGQQSWSMFEGSKAFGDAPMARQKGQRVSDGINLASPASELNSDRFDAEMRLQESDFWRRYSANNPIHQRGTPMAIQQDFETNKQNTLESAEDIKDNSENVRYARDQLLSFENPQTALQTGGQFVRSVFGEFKEYLGLQQQGSDYDVNRVSEKLQTKYDLNESSANYLSLRLMGRDEEAEAAKNEVAHDFAADRQLGDKVISVLDYAASSPVSFPEAMRPLMGYFGAVKGYEVNK